MLTKRNLLSGTAIKTEKGVFYIKNNARLIIPNRRVLSSWRFYRVTKVNESEVSHIPVVGKLGFRDGTLLFCIADGKYYMVSNNMTHHITSPDTIREHGLKRRDALVVSKAEISLHRRAE